ncbi:MAG TPA: hypothetical protein VJQ09_00495 [Candidatus Limnocylindria bacterium]|nr:hypothetical protein [Candidatus Limnocylindria bacterium]
MIAARLWRLVLVASLVSWSAGGGVADAKTTCPGKERWAVKTGVDADAGQVDTSTAKPATVTQMRAIPAPAQRPQDHRVGPTETTVFTITGFIARYKREPDQDYHLVLADPNRNEMVIEVPLTDCIKGTSPFRAKIVAARKAVDDVLQVTGQFPPTDSKIPVRVTGVGFFDAKGHGSGGTPNGIELHPVLEIVFNPSGTTTTPSGPTTTTTTQLISDGGFENGGQGWTASDQVITKGGKKVAHSGTSYAWLGGYGKVHTDTLSQQVTLPSSATTITLVYWISIDTKEKHSKGSTEITDVFDTLTLEVRGSGQPAVLAQLSNVNAHGTYSRATADLSSYKGQTVTISFTAVEDKSLQTSFLLDDISIEVQ